MPFPRFPDPPVPPVPVGGSYDSLTGSWSVMFDRLLADGVVDAANWHLLRAGGEHEATSAMADGLTVSGTAAIASGVMAIRYSPPPFDVLGADGAAVEGFEWPLLV